VIADGHREIVVVGVVGAALAGATGSLVGLAIPAAVIGGLNGAIAGKRKTYDWSSLPGRAAFVLDSTWALTTTMSSLVSHGVGALRGDAQYSTELSERKNRHVYSRGFQARKGFAITLGNVISGAGDVSRARRAKLITDHEDVHVWQARAFGPAYPVLYFAWTAGGAIAGAALWATVRQSEKFGKVVESSAYYMNPFEWWAYSRDDHWPPSGLLENFGWSKPAVQSFASRTSSSPQS
jgi:hypothetical protein